MPLGPELRLGEVLQSPEGRALIAETFPEAATSRRRAGTGSRPAGATGSTSSTPGNMTVETLAETVEGECTIALPGRECIALRLVAVGDASG